MRHRLARRGYDLLLVARSTRRMDKLAERLADETHRKIEIMAADLTNRNDLARLEQFLRDDPRVTVLVNNAGLGATSSLLNSDIGDMSRTIALNVEAPTQLTYAVVRHDHQHRLHRRGCPRASQWCVWRHESLCPWFQSIVAA
jgi:uncharacterized protein